ncbi:MAG: efflux RND transporter permease subunit [Saprospiraceae bacterium]
MPTRAPFSTLMLFAVLSVVGWGLLPLLNVQYIPSPPGGQLRVSYQWAGATPALIESQVTSPLEGAFALVDGVKRIYSVSGHGQGYIQLDLAEEAALDYLRFEIASKIRQLYPSFPKEVPFPQLSLQRGEEKQEDRPILVYALSGDEQASELYRYAAEVILPQLALESGLQQMTVSGGNRLNWRIGLDEAKMRALQVSPAQIAEALRSHFLATPMGQSTIGTHTTFIQLQTPSASALQAKDLLDIPIQFQKGRLIRLGELGTAQLVEERAYQYYRINGQNSIRILFYPNAQVNTIRLAAAVREKVKALTENLPPSYQLHLEDDATTYLSTELEKIKRRTLLSLGILLLFTLIVYRSWSYLFLIACSLVANLGIAFIAYYFFQVELHLYALAGITVSFGIIIDNTIVMAHHLSTQANRKVFSALLAATLTSMSALVIIFYLPEQWQLNLLDFAKVMMINLAVSLAIAWWFIPALMAYFQTSQKEKAIRFAAQRRGAWIWRTYHRGLSFLLRFRKSMVVATILAFGLPVFMLPNKVEGWHWYNQYLGNDWYVEEIKPIVNRLLGGTLRLFSWYVYEGSSYRQATETVLYIQGSMPQGTTIEQMNAVFHQIDQYLGQYPNEIKQYTTQVSSGQFGQTAIYFQPAHAFHFPHLLKSRLLAYSLNLGGVAWHIYGVGQGFSNANSGSAPSFRTAMYGYNKEELARQAQRFADQLLLHPRIQEVNTEANINWWEKKLYQYDLQWQNETMAALQLRPQQLVNFLQGYNQHPKTILSLPSGQTIQWAYLDASDKNLWNLQHSTQPLDSAMIRFADLAQLEKKQMSNALHKENQQYIRQVAFDYTGSARFGSLYLDEVIDQMRKEMPLGYAIKRQSHSFYQQEQQKLYGLLPLVIGLIFFICAIHFESLRQAWNIILLIPISFIGIFMTFYWFDFPFDQGGYTAFILLSGLVVNSLILILSDYNRLRQQFSKRTALGLYLKAFRQKITPILLSILSTGLGLIPFLLDGEQEVFWFALAVGTIGGLVFSVFVLLFITPVFYVRL